MNRSLLFARWLPVLAALAVAPHVATAQAAVARTGVADHAPGWTVKTATSNLDGSALVDLTLAATPPAAGWRGGVAPSLVLRCVEHAVWATVITGSPNPQPSGPEQATVGYQLDAGPRITESWNTVRSGNAVMAPEPGLFIRKLLTANTLHFEAPPVRGATPVFDFPLAGLSKVIGQFTGPCPLVKKGH